MYVIAMCYVQYKVHVTMSSWAINTLRRIAGDIMALDSGTFSSDVHESFISSLELAYRKVLEN